MLPGQPPYGQPPYPQPGQPAPQPGYAPPQGYPPQQPGYPPQPGMPPQYQPTPNQGVPPQAFAQPQAPGLNNPAILPVGEEWPEDGQLPEQMGGQRQTFLPGITTFALPANIAQCYHAVEIEDTREYLGNGMPNPTGPLGPGATQDGAGNRHGMKVARLQLKFDRNVPLVALDGKYKDLPFQATFTNNPRARGKKTDPKTPYISDMAYLSRVCLADPRVPREPAEFQAIFNEHAAAGHTIRLEHGLTGQCRKDKPRYILPFDPITRQYGETAVVDPSGAKGCGKRFYTSDFLNEQGGYDTKVACNCGMVSPQQLAQGYVHAMVEIRGYESVERFLEPAAAAPQVAVQGAAPQGV